MNSPHRASQLRAQAAFDELKRTLERERERIAKDMGIELTVLLIGEAKEEVEEGVHQFSMNNSCSPPMGPSQVRGMVEYMRQVCAAEIMHFQMLAMQQNHSRIVTPR